MISSTDFRTGLTIEIDGNAWQVVEFQHVKPGKGAAFVRTKIKNVETGAVVERTFNPNEKMPPARLDTRKMQFLYEEGGNYTFMDTETYEQTELTKEQLGDALNYLMENMEVNLQTFKNRIIGVNLPNSTGATKNATLETGYTVRVPLFINEGDVLRIDTRTGNYIERA